MALYEFTVEKYFPKDQCSKIFQYQIPAEDSNTAHMILGQTFHSRDEYDLIVIEWHKV